MSRLVRISDKAHFSFETMREKHETWQAFFDRVLKYLQAMGDSPVQPDPNLVGFDNEPETFPVERPNEPPGNYEDGGIPF